MFSTVTGPYGEEQLAVNGKPLYTYANDQIGSDVAGEGQTGFFVVGVDGHAIRARR